MLQPAHLSPDTSCSSGLQTEGNFTHLRNYEGLSVVVEAFVDEDKNRVDNSRLHQHGSSVDYDELSIRGTDLVGDQPLIMKTHCSSIGLADSRKEQRSMRGTRRGPRFGHNDW